MQHSRIQSITRVSLVAALLIGAACDDSTGPDNGGPADVNPVQASPVAVGVTHACGIASDGKTYCWGNNSYGLLGIGTTDLVPHPTPTEVVTGVRFRSIDSQGGFTCGLVQTGQVYCWGVDRGGSLGTTATEPCDGEIGPQPCSTVPIPITSSRTFSKLAVMWSHACALTADGQAYCWGNNNRGQAGPGGQTDTNSTPTLVSGSTRFTSITGGDQHTCGIATDSRVYCWGDNREGQMGTGDFSSGIQRFPTPVTTNLTFTAISGHGQDGGHTCGISDAKVYCWGSNDYGQLGVNSVTDVAVPTPVATDVEFAAIAAGYNWTCGLSVIGEAYCWGASVAGTIPSTTRTCTGPAGSLPCSPVPVHVGLGLRFVSLRAGFGSACGVTEAGVAYCWGANDTGKLGSGTTSNASTPTAIPNLRFPIPNS